MYPACFRPFASLCGFVLLLQAFAPAQAVHLKIPLTITDSTGHSATVYFGVDQYGSYCIDPFLGEFELPPDRCGESGLCFYFEDSRDETGGCLGNGLLLNYHAFDYSAQTDTYQVAISMADYPLTIRWPSTLSSYYDSAFIADLFGGTLANADMLSRDSLVISNSLVNRLSIRTRNPKGFVDGVRDNRREIPASFTLYQNYPNPFNPSTSIAYDVPARSLVSLRIYNVAGELIATLVDGDQPAGHYVVDWSPRDAASGVYYFQLRTPTRTTTRAMALVR